MLSGTGSNTMVFWVKSQSSLHEVMLTLASGKNLAKNEILQGSAIDFKNLHHVPATEYTKSVACLALAGQASLSTSKKEKWLLREKNLLCQQDGLVIMTGCRKQEKRLIANCHGEMFTKVQY